MKKLYNEKKRLIAKLNDINFKLDEQIIERFGFHYSQTDSDQMIDTLDCGTDFLEYADFVKQMNSFKKRMENGEWTPNH